LSKRSSTRAASGAICAQPCCPRLNLSQAVFAGVLNVSVKTVQAWEQGLRQPSDAALKLLTIAKKHPEVLLA
jgi:DNA-binding transcriptional regulator YiaG